MTAVTSTGWRWRTAGRAVSLRSAPATGEQELARRGAEARCGLQVIDLRSGDVAHWLRLEGMVSELYDVAVLPGVVRPTVMGFKSHEIRRTLAIGDEGVL